MSLASSMFPSSPSLAFPTKIPHSDSAQQLSSQPLQELHDLALTKTHRAGAARLRRGVRPSQWPARRCRPKIGGNCGGALPGPRCSSLRFLRSYSGRAHSRLLEKQEPKGTTHQRRIRGDSTVRDRDHRLPCGRTRREAASETKIWKDGDTGRKRKDWQ